MAKFLARVKPSSPAHRPGRATDAWTVGPISEPAEVPDGRAGREIAIIGVWLLGRSEDKRHLGRRSCEIIEIDRLPQVMERLGSATGFAADDSCICASRLTDLLCDSKYLSQHQAFRRRGNKILERGRALHIQLPDEDHSPCRVISTVFPSSSHSPIGLMAASQSGGRYPISGYAIEKKKRTIRKGRGR